MLRNLMALTGMPVVDADSGKRIGRVLRAGLCDDMSALRGLCVSVGLKGVRFYAARDIALLGEVAVFARGKGEKREPPLSALPRRAVSTDGRLLGAIVTAYIDADTLSVRALELKSGFWDDLLRGRRVVREFARAKNGDVIVKEEGDRLYENRMGTGYDRGRSHRRVRRDHVRHDELADGKTVGQGGRAGRKDHIRKNGVLVRQISASRADAAFSGARRPSACQLLLCAAAVAVAAGLILFVPALREPLRVVFFALILAFLMSPLTEAFIARGLRRSVAVFFTFLICFGTLLGALFLIVIPALPALLRAVEPLLQRFERLRALPVFDRLISLNGANDYSKMLSSLLAGASSVGGCVARIGMTVALAYMYLLGWTRLSLRLIMLVPQSARGIALRMTGGARRQLSMYFRGQAVIIASVSLLAAAAFAFLRLPMPLFLGFAYGLTDIIPYFGPFIGAIAPMVLALCVSWRRAIATFSVLLLIQQIDNYIIAPRVIGQLTGVGPAGVLIALTVGSALWGVAGMLLALPVLLTARTCMDIWATRRENPEGI